MNIKKTLHRKLALGATLLTFAGVLSSPVSMVVAKADVTDPGFTSVCTDDGSSDGGQNGTNTGNTPQSGGGSQGGSSPFPGVAAADAGNPKTIFNFFVQKMGFSGAGAAAAVGNAYCESTFSPKADNGDHFGLFQWTSDRMKSPLTMDQGTWTVDNELKNAQRELDGPYKAVKDKVGNSSDPSDACSYWQYHYEVCGDGTAKRQLGTKIAYSQFGGANIKANSALLGASMAAAGAGSDNGSSTNSNSSNSDNPNCAGNGSSSDGSGQADGDIVKIARSMMGWFHYPNPDRHNVQMCTKDGKLNSKDDLNKDGQTDCSGFVWIVLKLARYSVPPAMGWYTKTMAEDAKGPHKWFKQIDPKDAKPGDVIIVNEGDGAGANGHTAIITSNWQGYDNTKCINEGGDDETVFHNNGVCEDTIRRQFWTMLDNGDVTIAEPVKASNSGK